MPPRGHGLTTKASRSRARSAPPEEEEIALAVQRLRDKLRESQPFYTEEDVVVIPFPSSDSANTSPAHGSVPTNIADVPPFTLDDAVSPPGSPTRAAPPGSSTTRANANTQRHATPAAGPFATIDLDVPLSPALFLTAVNLLDTKSIVRSRRIAMDTLKLVGQGYTLIWQDDAFIVDAAKHPPTPAVSFLNEDSVAGRRSSSPAMGGVRAAVRTQTAELSSTSARSHKSVSPVPTYRPAPHLVTMLDECMQSLLVYANKSSTLSQFITAHQPTLHLFCFIGSAARAVEEGGEWADTTELINDRSRPCSSSSVTSATALTDTVALPQRDVQMELRELNHLWEACGLAGTRLLDHLRECYLTDFLLDAALPPAVCSARYDGIATALAEKKRRLIAELASSRSPLTNMMCTLPLRSLMGLLNMSASAEPKQRAKLLDKLTAEGLLDVVLQNIRASIGEWLHWATPSSSSSPPPPSSTASSAATAEGNTKHTTSPQKSGFGGSPPSASSTQDSHWSVRRRPSPKHASKRASPSPPNTQECVPHLQYLPLTPPPATAVGGNGAAAAASSSAGPTSGKASTSGVRGRKSRASREETRAELSKARPEPPLVCLGFCVEVLLLLTSPNLRHPQEADELAQHPKTAASAVVRATAWAEETTAVESLVAYLLWIVAASSTAFEEEVSLALYRVPTSLLASLQEQAMDCVLQLALHNSMLYGVVVQTLERLLSDRLVLLVGNPAESVAQRGTVSPARRAPTRSSGSSPASAKQGRRTSTTSTLGTTSVRVRLTGAGGLLPLLVSLLARADEAQRHARYVRTWFTWLTTHLVPSAFEYPTLTRGRRSTLAWGTTAAAATATAMKRKSKASTSPQRTSRSRSSTPPPQENAEAPVLGRDLRRDEVASLLPYFRFGTRLVLETSWRDGAEPFLARLAILAYHVVLGRRNNLSFGQASVCYDVVAPLLKTVTGLLPGQIVELSAATRIGDDSRAGAGGEATPGASARDWLKEDFVFISTPSKTPTSSEAGAHSASPNSARKTPQDSRRGASPRRDGAARPPRDSVQTFIPSPSRSPIFYEAYSPSSADSPVTRKESPPRTPSKSAPATPGQKRGRSLSNERLEPPAPMAKPSSPPPATACSPLATTRASWRDRLSLRMFLSSLSLTGASSTPHRDSGDL